MTDSQEAAAWLGMVNALPIDNNGAVDLQHINRKPDHRQAVWVGVSDNVGDVAINKQFTRQQVNNPSPLPGSRNSRSTGIAVTTSARIC